MEGGQSAMRQMMWWSNKEEPKKVEKRIRIHALDAKRSVTVQANVKRNCPQDG